MSGLQYQDSIRNIDSQNILCGIDLAIMSAYGGLSRFCGAQASLEISPLKPAHI